MSKSTWADAAKGDDVVLNGKSYRVRKIKRDGKLLKVTVELGGRSFTSIVKAKAPVKIVATPLRNAENGQARWATEREHRAAVPERRTSLEAGDPAVTKPPAKPSGDDWQAPADKVERKLGEVLGARLVGEASDESSGYYVPLPDVTTIASHLSIFHPNTYDPAKDEATMLTGHAHEHRMVLDGKARLTVNHWHTKNRP